MAATEHLNIPTYEQFAQLLTHMGVIADSMDIIEDAQEMSYTAEAWAVGTKNGIDVGSSDPQYHNNSKYYAEQAEAVAESIPEDYSELSDDVDQLKKALITDTASGTIASFTDGADDFPVRDLTVQMEPIQDLHGYENPWPAGGGVNKLDPTTMVAHSASAFGLTITILNDGIVNLAGTWTGLTSDSARVIDVSNAVRSYNVKAFESTNHVTARWQSGEDVIVFRFSNMTNGNTYNLNVGTVIYEGSTVPTAYTPYSNICPISGRTGVTVTRTGFNVWDEEWEVGAINDATGANVSANDNIRSKNYIKVFPNTVYYGQANGYSLRKYYYDANKTYIDHTVNTIGEFITPSNCHYIRFRTGSLNSATYGTTYKNDICINISDPAKNGTYEPYQGQTYPVTFPSSAGTVYGGTVDVTTGVLTVDRAMHTVSTSDSTRLFGALANCVRVGIVTSGAKTPTWNTQEELDIISNCAKTDASPVHSSSAATADECCLYKDGSYVLAVFTVPTDSGTSASTALQYLVNNGCAYCYPLATPQTYQLTPQQVTTLLGWNNIWSDADSVSVDYVADAKLYIDKGLESVNTLRLSIAPVEDGATASQAYAQGKYFFHNGDFCKAKTAIASGATFTLNTNFEVTTVAAELYAALH